MATSHHLSHPRNWHMPSNCSSAGKLKGRITSHQSSLGAIACRGCVSSTPVVSIVSLPDDLAKSDCHSCRKAKQANGWSQELPANCASLCPVQVALMPPASFCFDLSLLLTPSCRHNNVAFEAVALLCNRLSNWLAMMTRAMREDISRVYFSWILLRTTTVWDQGVTLKLRQTIPDGHLARFIINVVSNRSFILKTSKGQCSCFRRPKNEVPQGSTLVPMFFNIYISDISVTVSTQYGYADDLTHLFSRECWNEVEEVLSLDMQKLLICYLHRGSGWTRPKLHALRSTWTIGNPAVSLRSPWMVPLSPTVHPKSNLPWSHCWSATHLQATLGNPLWQSQSS